jgi:hypothetical protein
VNDGQREVLFDAACELTDAADTLGRVRVSLANLSARAARAETYEITGWIAALSALGKQCEDATAALDRAQRVIYPLFRRTAP